MIIDTTKNIPLFERLHADIKKIRASASYKRPLSEPTCLRDTPVGMIRRTFLYRSGRTVEVRCHAKVMVALMRAMLEAPGIEVTATADSMYSGSYRSWAQQNALYVAYKNGTGHKAANPCSGYHRRGRALDILNASAKEKEALLAARAGGQRFYNGADFGDPPHYSFAAHG